MAEPDPYAYERDTIDWTMSQDTLFLPPGATTEVDDGHGGKRTIEGPCFVVGPVKIERVQ